MKTSLNSQFRIWVKNEQASLHQLNMFAWHGLECEFNMSEYARLNDAEYMQ